MAKSLQKIEAQKLRRGGESIQSIAKKLLVSKSTASLWCKDIMLGKEQQEHLLASMIRAGTKGRTMGVQSNKNRREERLRYWEQISKQEFKALASRDRLFVAAALYWGEGSKDRKFSFSNSDPGMILFMYQWLIRDMKIKKKDVTIRILINTIHEPRIGTVLKFWADLLELSPEQMYRPTFIQSKNKKIYENHERYYGTVSMRIRKSTDFQYRLLSLVKALKTRPV